MAACMSIRDSILLFYNLVEAILIEKQSTPSGNNRRVFTVKVGFLNTDPPKRAGYAANSELLMFCKYRMNGNTRMFYPTRRIIMGDTWFMIIT